MAFTRFSGFTVDWTTKATVISGQATNFKTWLNTRTTDLLTWLTNTFLAELEQTTDGDSGADNVGMTKLTNYGSAAAATIQAQAEALDTALSTHEADGAPHSGAGVPVILSSTGQKIQKGQTTITASGSGITTNIITFPSAFANAPLVFVTMYDASNTGGYITIWAANPSTTAFTLAINVYTATSLGISWLAIGS